MNDALPKLAPIEPLAQLSGRVCSDLRARLVAAGYGGVLLREAEAVAPAQLDAVRLPLVQRWLLRRADEGARLALLFEYFGSLSRSEAERALTAPLLEALLAAGAVEDRAGAITASVRLTPLDGLYLLSDPYRAGADAVMGPGPTTLDLVRAISEQPGSVLDVGCGAGTLALVGAARGATRALGVDVNDRAIALARLNARLNDLQAEFRCGDLLEPAAGEQFDLVLSQPPYVVRPAGVAQVTYLHGGARGDELALRFAAAFPQALSPRGRALLLFDSPPAPDPVHERLRAALGEQAVDLVVLAAPGPSADLAAVGYASTEDPELGDGYRAALERYRDHLDLLGAGPSARVLAILQRASGATQATRLDAQLAVGGLSELDGARLDRLLASLALAGAAEPEVLAARVRLAPGARLVEERLAGELSREPARSIRFGKGALATSRELSEAGAFLFAALEDSQTVAEAVAQFAEASGETVQSVRPTVTGFVREGLSRALLVPAP